jgi:hypothetical protein
MTQALALVAENPNLTAAQLAARINVSLGYARTLLRRAKAKHDEIPAPQSAVRPGGLDNVVSDLRRRLDDAESRLDSLIVPTTSTQSINYNRRSQVLRLHQDGKDPASIAEKLGIPQGEVAFIVKVDRLLVRNV